MKRQRPNASLEVRSGHPSTQGTKGKCRWTFSLLADTRSHTFFLSCSLLVSFLLDCLARFYRRRWNLHPHCRRRRLPHERVPRDSKQALVFTKVQWAWASETTSTKNSALASIEATGWTRMIGGINEWRTFNNVYSIVICIDFLLVYCWSKIVK
jgi:hypothetical protein